MTINFLKKFLLIGILIIFHQPCQSSECQPFADSFLTAYEFNTSGRYAHEYHPFILQKTSSSMLELEKGFKDAGMQTPGRYVLMGYEENAFPAFFPRMHDSMGQTIDDESSFKDPRGWSIQLHNRFGTMTGFLFRNIVPAKGNQQFVHVCPERVEIFYPGLTNLQKYAFGPLAGTMFKTEAKISALIKTGDWKGVLKQLITFWQGLYRGEYKTGDSQVAGTQDILFSIENAKLLQRSELPLMTFFTGPDITYPIVVSQTCKAEATANAQKFLSHFMPKLKPINQQKTLYVFRSFVDGVGKSTLLGNIKNWIANKDNYQNYNIVDNTSTLEFELFPLNEDVWIADLPAQISHFTYKPDGSVWVDMKAVTTNQQAILPPQQHFAQQLPQLKYNYLQLIGQCKQLLAQHGPEHPTFNDMQRPEFALVRNMLLLHTLEKNRWIPFQFNGKHYLGNYLNPQEIKLFSKIGQARSEGLKNADASQMIFDQGLALPALYKEFVAKLVDQAKEQKITNVVFVDFLSMYSRSSRENIRLNFLLQTLSKMDFNFNPFNSTYRNFISNSELLAMLIDRQSSAQCLNGLRLETLVRYGLYEMMQQIIKPNVGCRNISQTEVFEFLQKFKQQLKPEELANIDKKTKQKVTTETNNLYKNYRHTKEYCNLYSLNFKHICRLSGFMQRLFGNHKNPDIAALWQHLEHKIVSPVPEADGWVDNVEYVVKLANGDSAQLLCVISPENRDIATMTKFMRTLRSAWYLSAINLLLATELQANGTWLANGPEEVRQLPAVVHELPDGRIALLTTYLPKKVTNDDGFEQIFSSTGKADYFYDFAFKSTAQTFFIFGADINPDKFNYDGWGESAGWYQPGFNLTWDLKDINGNYGTNRTVNSDVIWQKHAQYSKHNKKYLLQDLQRQANSQKQQPHPQQKEASAEDNILQTLKHNISNSLSELDSRNENEALDFDHLNYDKQSQKHSIVKQLMPDKYLKSARAFARIVATIECVIRDLDSPIITAAQQDLFIASLKLIEHSMLVQNFGMVFAKELFNSNDLQLCRPVILLDN